MEMGGRLAALRGRRLALGLPGFDGLSLSEFLDIIWADLWDDVGGFADRIRYREAIHAIFIEGKEPPRDPNDPPVKPTGKEPIPSSSLAMLEQMKERAAQLRAERQAASE